MSAADLSVWEYAARSIEQRLSQIRPPLLAHQKPPEGDDWRLWLLEAGRGAGKTEACARYFSRWMHDHPGSRGRIIAPTRDDAVDACVNGPSGLKAIDDQVQYLPSRAGGAVVEWPNGSVARVLGMDAPRDVDRLRAAGNRDIDWWEELAAIRHLQAAWDQAKFGLRRGTRPHSIASTTPRATPDYRAIRKLPRTAIVKASMYDNPYLPQDFIDDIESTYAHTRLGRQEIHAEVLEDVEGAFWSIAMLETVKWRRPLPTFESTVTAVDSSGSSTGDATGIVTVGADDRSIPWVVADDTTKGSPEHRYREVVLAAYKHQSSVILYEDTYGGDNIGSNIRSAWDTAKRQGEIDKDEDQPRLLPTSRLKPRLKGNKADRAGVIAALYEQHVAGVERVWHVPGLVDLEDEMTTWEEDSSWSANRLDAAVWGVRYHTRSVGKEERSHDMSTTMESFRLGFRDGPTPFGNRGIRR